MRHESDCIGFKKEKSTKAEFIALEFYGGMNKAIWLVNVCFVLNLEVVEWWLSWNTYFCNELL